MPSRKRPDNVKKFFSRESFFEFFIRIQPGTPLTFQKIALKWLDDNEPGLMPSELAQRGDKDYFKDLKKSIMRWVDKDKSSLYKEGWIVPLEDYSSDPYFNMWQREFKRSDRTAGQGPLKKPNSRAPYIEGFHFPFDTLAERSERKMITESGDATTSANQVSEEVPTVGGTEDNDQAAPGATQDENAEEDAAETQVEQSPPDAKQNQNHDEFYGSISMDERQQSFDEEFDDESDDENIDTLAPNGNEDNTAGGKGEAAHVREANERDEKLRQEYHDHKSQQRTEEFFTPNENIADPAQTGVLNQTQKKLNVFFSRSIHKLTEENKELKEKMNELEAAIKPRVLKRKRVVHESDSDDTDSDDIPLGQKIWRTKRLRIPDEDYNE